MRIVLGHVTNSSSSSFIVWLPKMPTSIEEVKNMFFGNVDFITHNVYDGWNDETKDYETHNEYLNTLYISESLFQNMGKLNKKKIKKEITEGTPYPDLWVRNTIGEYPCSFEGEWEEKRPRWPGPNASDEDKEKYERDYRIYFEKLDEVQNEWVDKVIKLYNEKYKKGVVVSWEYSDNDGNFWSFMEHDMPTSLIVPYIRISKH